MPRVQAQTEFNLQLNSSFSFLWQYRQVSSTRRCVIWHATLTVASVDTRGPVSREQLQAIQSKVVLGSGSWSCPGSGLFLPCGLLDSGFN